MSFTGKPTNANELILWNGTNFYSGKITGNNIDPASTTTIQINGEFIGTSFGINNGTTIPTLASGTGVPSTTPPNGSLFMRTDGTSSTGLYTYQSGTWVSVTGSSSFTAGGDLTGTSTNQTVIAIQGNAIESGTLNSTEDGYVLTWVNASSQWQPKPTLGETVTIYGDVTGTTTASTVVAIQGNTVTAGALTKGQFLVATSTSNWASTSLSGDISESATTPGQLTVLKINGTSVPATPTANQVLVATSGTTSTWAQIVDANVASGASISYSKLNLSNSIVNADINTSAGISGSKITPNFGTQSLTAGTSILGTSTSANSITGSLTFTTVTETTTYTVDSSEADYYVFADTTGGAWTLTLPAPTNGRTIVVKDSKQNFATANLTVARHGSEKIDGVSASLVLNINNQEVVFASDGTDWFTDNFARSTTGTAGGDLTGSYPNPTVAKVDGVSYPASPSTNTVPVVTGANTVTYQQIADAQVSATAGIAGTKIGSNFGSQNVTTTGNISTTSTGSITSATTVTATTGVITPSVDTAGATTLLLGTTNANKVQIGTVGNTTEILGNLTVDGAETIVGTSTFQANVTFDGNVTVADGYNFTVVGNTAGTYSINGHGASSLTTNSGALTITGASASTWSTSAGALTLSGASGINLQNAGTTEVSIGSSTVAVTPATIQWTTAVSSPILNQASTSSGNGTNLTIQAQGATGASNNGGNLILAGGTSGSATIGNIQLVGTTVSIGGGGGVIGITDATTIPSGNPSGGAILYSSGGILNIRQSNGVTFPITSSATTFTAGGDLTGSASSQQVISLTGTAGIVSTASSTTTIQFNTASSSPTISQADKTTGSGTGNALTIQAQNETGTTSTGGALNLTSGTGTTVAGTVNIQTGASTKLAVSPTTVTITDALTQSGGAVSLTGNATSSFTTSSGSLTLSGNTGTNIQNNGTTIASVDANKLYAQKGWRQNVTSVTASTYTILATDNFIAVDPTSNTVALTLPSSPNTGDTFLIKDISGKSGTNTITITPASGNIDGNSNFALDVNYASITVIYSGAQWSVC